MDLWSFLAMLPLESKSTQDDMGPSYEPKWAIVCSMPSSNREKLSALKLSTIRSELSTTVTGISTRSESTLSEGAGVSVCEPGARLFESPDVGGFAPSTMATKNVIL
jgi:hypothetical protein